MAFFGLIGKYKCINCGKKHNGNIFAVDINGEKMYSNLADFCSPKCFEKYIFQHGYTLKRYVALNKEVCIICGKEHDNTFYNVKKKKLTHDFCSKKCLQKAIKTFPNIKEIKLFKNAQNKTPKNIPIGDLFEVIRIKKSKKEKKKDGN